MENFEPLEAYRAISNQDILSFINSYPRTVPFQNTATPTAIGQSDSAVVTVGDFPLVLDSFELGQISDSSTTLPESFYLQFNIYDADNLGLFGGDVSPRASTVFGAPTQIPYAIQPLKVFPPRTRLRIEWTNRDPSAALGFELLFNFIEIIDPAAVAKQQISAAQQQELLEELVLERRTR